MIIQLTIIGLGQIGASIGLALTSETEHIYRIGYDVRSKVRRQAAKMEAVDKSVSLLKKVIETSDMIVMALPTDEMRPMMEEIVPLMKDGAVLLDTALGKEKIAIWAAELLPEGCAYVGLTPAINPVYLTSTASGIEAARADLFHGGTIVISSPPNTESGGIKLAADLAQLLGAEVLFADILEVDSMMTATHTVPQLMAVALLNATVNQPNWRDAGKMAGRAYAEASAPIEHLGLPGTLAASAMQNRDHVLRALDSVIASIEALRDDIANEDTDNLIQCLEHARTGRDQWLGMRDPEAHPQEKPDYVKPSLVSKLFGVGGRKGAGSKE